MHDNSRTIKRSLWKSYDFSRERLSIAVIHELEIIHDDLERLENKALPFGERLKRIMEKAGYTPESLGKKTD